MPNISEAKLRSVGDSSATRERFFESYNSNLDYLLSKRYSWMNEYIGPGHKGLEIGSGAGLSKVYLSEHNYETSDAEANQWLDRTIDATNIPYSDNSLDFIFESNVLHHIAKPMLFIAEAKRVLRPGGVLLIQDVWGSTFMRLILHVFRTEGYSYEVDVFDTKKDATDANRPWAGNNVILNLMFTDRKKFEKITEFTIDKLEYSEGLRLFRPPACARKPVYD
jgi:SAM-dependent methyltransferase